MGGLVRADWERGVTGLAVTVVVTHPARPFTVDEMVWVGRLVEAVEAALAANPADGG